jgi:hypothetical protein
LTQLDIACNVDYWANQQNYMHARYQINANWYFVFFVLFICVIYHVETSTYNNFTAAFAYFCVFYTGAVTKLVLLKADIKYLRSLIEDRS